MTEKTNTRENDAIHEERFKRTEVYVAHSGYFPASSFCLRFLSSATFCNRLSRAPFPERTAALLSLDCPPPCPVLVTAVILTPLALLSTSPSHDACPSSSSNPLLLRSAPVQQSLAPNISLPLSLTLSLSLSLLPPSNLTILATFLEDVKLATRNAWELRHGAIQTRHSERIWIKMRILRPLAVKGSHSWSPIAALPASVLSWRRRRPK